MWLPCDELAGTIDTYFANHTYGGRPKSTNVGNKQLNTTNNVSAFNPSEKSLNMGNGCDNPGKANASQNRVRAAQIGKTQAHKVKNDLCYTC